MNPATRIDSKFRADAHCAGCTQDIITTDFCYDYLAFSPGGIDLRLPGGLSFDMMKYWDGQPVRFVCCERVAKGELVDGLPWGRVYWCVAIENAEEDESEKSVILGEEVD